MQATPPPSPTPTLAIPRHCATSVPVLTSTTSSRGNFFVINSTYLVRTPCLDPLNEEDRRTWFELCHHDSFCTAANNLIRDILAKNGLTSKNNSLFGGRDETKPRDYGQTTWAIHISQLVELPQTWHPIIVIGAEWKPESSLAHWARVVPEMKDAFDRFLDANQIPGPGVNVRMESPEAYRPRQLHALVGRPDLDSAWPGIKAQVRAVLQGLEEARDQWDCIALFGLGYLCDNSSDGGDMPEETLPTVYISFHRDCSEARWTPVREALASLLGTYELSFYLEHSAPEAVDVFRLYGQRHLANCWSALRANGPYTGTTCLGQDISATSYTVAEGGSKPISVNPPTGTLGCHIELRLQEDGPWEQFALTTYQTVRGAINGFARDRRGSPGTPSPSSALHRTDRAGFRPGDADVADALMQCPSLACYDRTLSSLCTAAKGPPRRTRAIDSIRRDIAFVDRGDHILGSLFAGSGLAARTPDSGLLDWALIRLAGRARAGYGSNVLPPRGDWITGHDRRLGQYWPSQRAIRAHRPALALQDLRMGARELAWMSRSQYRLRDKRVFFRGAESNAVFGCISRHRADVARRSVGPRHGRTVTEELVLVGESRGDLFDKSTVGDSGSVVWDSKGCALGLLRRALLSNDKYLVAYVTPLEYVFKHITAMLGLSDDAIRIAQGN